MGRWVATMRFTAPKIAFSRASRGWPGAVRITPASITATSPPPASMMPKPVSVSPGSTPITRSGLAARGSGGADGVEDVVRDVVVRVDGLNVVLLLQRLDEPQDRGGVLALDSHGGLRQHGAGRLGHRCALGLER